ncbi:MAG TPA: amidohydrolase family protein [Pyrinomonadaceae bacterium]|nr:amidohydrolase family protein [Pyrinomonadaceae bacterium]
MIIDSHQHFWQVGRFDYPWMTPDLGVLYRDYLPETLEPILDRNAVVGTILVQASNSLPETEWLLNLAERHQFIAGVVGWVDLTDPEMSRDLEGFKSHPKFKGVRHLVESEPADDWLSRPEVIRGLQTLEKHNVAFDLLVHTRHLAHVETVAAASPQLRLVVDHLAKPPIAAGTPDEIAAWAKALKAVAAYPNVSCKLSGLVTEANHSSWDAEDLRPFVERALEFFGPARLMFGSDWPVCLLAAPYPEVLGAFQYLLREIKEEEWTMIFSGNATEFYQL